jgi:tetratricopeptide (TPR) repeat protein
MLPPRLVFRETNPDYGIDGEVEEFDESDEATGRRFYVQLKATDETKFPDALRERIKNTTAEYLRAQQAPVLMVRYIAPTRTLYARWFHEFDPYYEHVGETHLTFHWSEDDQLSEERVERLLSEAGRLIELRSGGLTLPVTVVLDVPEGGVHDHARAELQLAFESAVARCPADLRLADDREDAYLTASISDDAVTVSLSGLSSITFHLGEGVYPPETPAHLIMCDVLSCVAFTLGRAGRGDAAARIAVHFFPDSMLSGVPRLVAELGSATMDAGRVAETLELADRLDQNDESEDGAAMGFVLLAIVREHETSLQPHEQDRLEAALRGRFERRLEAGRNHEAAAAAENLGLHLMAVRRPTVAVEFLEQAIKLDPSREGEDLAQALAGAYFLSHRYAEAVPAYDRAIEWADAPDPHLHARRADALMYVGRYRDALSAFSAIETDDPRLGAWIYVKGEALNWVIEATGIERQEPDHETATRLAGEFTDVADAEADEFARRIWERDAASPLGWFNYARVLLDRDLPEEAMLSYLTAAVMSEADVEAWVNVGLLAINLEDEDMFIASAITGDKLNPNDYMDGFARQLRLEVSDVASRGALITLVKEAIAEVGGASPVQEQ